MASTQRLWQLKMKMICHSETSLRSYHLFRRPDELERGPMKISRLSFQNVTELSESWFRSTLLGSPLHFHSLCCNKTRGGILKLSSLKRWPVYLNSLQFPRRGACLFLVAIAFICEQTTHTWLSSPPHFYCR